MFTGREPEAAHTLKTELHLVEPYETFNTEFSTLRNELTKHEIQFQKHFGFDKVKQLMKDKINNHLVVIHNKEIGERDVPGDLVETPNLSIFFYPQSENFKRFKVLKNSGAIRKEYENKNKPTSKKNKHIQLRSIKRDISKSPDGKVVDPYQELVIFSDDNSQETQQFNHLVDVLNSSSNATILNKQKKLATLTTMRNKYILLTSIDSLTSIMGVMQKKNLQKVNLAVFGVRTHDSLNRKQIGIATSQPLQIIKYIEEAGFHLPGAFEKYNLIKQTKFTTPQPGYTKNNMVKETNEVHQLGNQTQNLNKSSKKKPKVVKVKNNNGKNNSQVKNQLKQQKSDPMVINVNTITSDLEAKQEVFQYEKAKKNSELSQGKKEMNWVVKLGEKNQFVTEPLDSITSEKHQFKNGELAAEAPKNISSVSANKGKGSHGYVPANVIQEVSDQYRGSNRQSFIVDDLSRNGMREGIEEGMKKKKETSYSEFRDMKENQEFERQRRSSDLALGSSGEIQIRERVEDKTNHIEAYQPLENIPESKKELHAEPEQVKRQVRQSVQEEKYEIMKPEDVNIKKVDSEQNFYQLQSEVKNIPIDIHQSKEVLKQEKEQVEKQRENIKEEVLKKGSVKVIKSTEIIKYQNSKEDEKNEQVVVERIKQKAKEPSRYISYSTQPINEPQITKIKGKEQGFSYQKGEQDKVRPSPQAQEYRPQKHNASEYRQYVSHNMITPERSSEKEILESRKAPEYKPHTYATPSISYETESKSGINIVSPRSNYQATRTEEQTKQAPLYNVQRPSYQRIERYDGRSPEYRHNSDANREVKTIQKKKDVVIDSKTFNFDEYDRTVDERGIVVYKKKVSNSNTNDYRRTAEIAGPEKRVINSREYTTQESTREKFYHPSRYEKDEKSKYPPSDYRENSTSNYKRIENNKSPSRRVEYETSGRTQPESYRRLEYREANKTNENDLSSRRVDYDGNRRVEGDGSKKIIQYYSPEYRRVEENRTSPSQKAYEIKSGREREGEREYRYFYADNAINGKEKRYSTVNSYGEKYQGETHENQPRYITPRQEGGRKYESNYCVVETARVPPRDANQMKEQDRQAYYKVEKKEEVLNNGNYTIRSARQYRSSNNTPYKQISEYRQGRVQYENKPLANAQRPSLLEERRESSIYTDPKEYSREFSTEKISKPHVYHEIKPFTSSKINRVESKETYEIINEEYKNLSIQPNCFHYIIDQTSNLEEQVASIATFKDNVDICSDIEEVRRKVSKKSLPTTVNDLGFIFLSEKNFFDFDISLLQEGYFLVKIEHGSEIQIQREEKEIKINQIENLILAKKLLLGEKIEHLLFYYNHSNSELSRILKLFPNKKFQQYKYTNRSDLESLLNIHLKNKGRMVRVIIFVSQKNIHLIADTMKHQLNFGTFIMICRHMGNQKQVDNMKKKYPNITFLNSSDYNSYGSLLDLATRPDFTHLRELEKSDPKSIFIDFQHRNSGVQSFIKREFPEKYQIFFFEDLQQVTPNKQTILIIHPDVHYDTKMMKVRQFQCVYMLGWTRHVPSGTIRIQIDDLKELL